MGENALPTFIYMVLSLTEWHVIGLGVDPLVAAGLWMTLNILIQLCYLGYFGILILSFLVRLSTLVTEDNTPGSSTEHMLGSGHKFI